MDWATDQPPGSRYEKELISPVDYLRMSYYEKWLTGFVNLLLKGGMITQAELETGKPVAGTRRGKLLTAAEVPAALKKGDSSTADGLVPEGVHHRGREGL